VSSTKRFLGSILLLPILAPLLRETLYHLKTAVKIGIRIPPEILLEANEVIQ
jgi:hypothetical protein